MTISTEQAEKCITLLNNLDLLALETFPIKHEEHETEDKDQQVLVLRLKARRKWQECSATFIDAYIGLHPELTPEEIQTLQSWKNRKRDQYVVTAYTDETATVLHAKTLHAYEITHLTDTFGTVLPKELPTAIETTLLPYQGTIIWDGLILLLTSGPVKKEIADFYTGITNIMQKNNAIIRSL